MVCESVISSEWPYPLSSSIHFEQNMIQGMYDVGVYIYTHTYIYIHIIIYIYITYIYIIYHIYISYIIYISYNIYIYMVGGLEHFFIYWKWHHPNWLSLTLWHHGTLFAPLLLHQSGWTPTPRGDECGPRMAKRARSMALYERREIQLWIPIVPW